MKNLFNKKGQLTLFVIIAILIIGIIAGYFLFRNVISQEQIPSSMEPVYTTFLSCVEENLQTGIDVLESQGGYITLPEFEAGSRYMPFSSQLNFLGNSIPYWYYVSGNNIAKEQVPTKTEMQEQLANFIDSKIRKCRFDAYYDQGFAITLGEPKSTITISNGQVEADVNMNLEIERGDENALVKTHKIIVNSNLQQLYDTATQVYQKEQKELFLENYGIDILRMYAPVDGVELTCSPKVWSADDVFDKLKEAIEINTQELKTSSGTYTLTNERNKYFIIDFNSDADVRFLNSKDWPNGFDISPSDGNVLTAKPVGSQEGLGILGFCYVSYHFVYNAKYPVLTQVSIGNEIFQFPMAVVISGNRPREALNVSAVGVSASNLCENKNTNVKVNTYDGDLQEIPAQISYECLDAECYIGESPLIGKFPQCVNGYVIARADGYQNAKYLVSTVNEGNVDILMNKLYKKDVVLNLDGAFYNRSAIITFTSDADSKTIVYPEQKTVDLAEGQYNVQVYVYKNSSITLAQITKQQCIQVAQDGLGGILGLTTEKCFDVTIPSQIVSNVLYGGGTGKYYVLESELKDTTEIELNAQSLTLPTTIEQLQSNYILFDQQGLDISLK
jgi:hypothetical protein